MIYTVLAIWHFFFPLKYDVMFLVHEHYAKMLRGEESVCLATETTFRQVYYKIPVLGLIFAKVTIIRCFSFSVTFCSNIYFQY